MSEVEMTHRATRENRLIETVETVFEAHSFLPGNTSVQRGVSENNFEKFASGLFEEQSRGEVHKTKPTKSADRNVDDKKQIERTLRRPKEHE